MIYLDNAATSFPKPESVYKAIDRFAREDMANPGRAGHKMALAAERVLDDCRHRLNQLFKGSAPERFIFTLNCTDALNMAFKGLLNEGDHVITTNLEHNSISRPLRIMELAGKISVTKINADSQGFIDPEQIKNAIGPKTRLVALTHASNVLGTIQPITEVGTICREKNIIFLVDGAQTAGVIPIDIKAQKIDLLACPGHKCLFGPTGTGFLYSGERVALRTWREGGTGGDSSTETQPKEMPYHLEGGTPNVLGIAGLAAGLAWVDQEGMNNIHHRETKLVEKLRSNLKEIPGVTVFGSDDLSRTVATVSFQSESLAAPEIGSILDEAFNIAVRPGLHCSPYIHKSINTFPDGSVRISPGAFNTESDIDQIIAALKEILSL
ncbi:MAG: aminotransferase class V-fold PLP-dependent enzyme [Planctomycetota bacterium]|nr:MAG: aminotransferase class V-fold PLP-dependent enzyme [Planctomycetota bacterium]